MQLSETFNVGIAYFAMSSVARIHFLCFTNTKLGCSRAMHTSRLNLNGHSQIGFMAMQLVCGLLVVCCLFVPPSIAISREVKVSIDIDVDFGRSEYYPLLKGKASLFQEGLANLPTQEAAWGPMADLRIRAFRPLVRLSDAGPGIGGIFQRNSDVVIRKNKLWDTFIRLAHSQKVLPLLTLWGTPKPYQIKEEERPSRIAPPRDMAAYVEGVTKLTSLHAGQTPLLWEIWNEPQNREFFDSPELPRDYNLIYKHLAPAILAANADCLIVGPAMANEEKVIENFTREFVANVKRNRLPLHYYSIHSYGRFKKELYERRRGFDDRTAGLVDLTRRFLAEDFQIVPLVFTEYERYPAGADIPWHPLREEPIGAVSFLVDLDYFIRQTDIPFVTWNRYQNRGPQHRPGGLIDQELHRRPIYHAFKFYGMMPTERKLLSMKRAPEALGGFAAADESGAGILLWNESQQDREIELSISSLPFSSGKLAVYRIEQEHANYLQGTSDECEPVLERGLESLPSTLSLYISGPGILYVDLRPDEQPSQLPAVTAKYIRSWQWAGRTKAGISGDYGDFDWRTWTARIGVKRDRGRGLCGVTIDETPAAIGFDVRTFKLNPKNDANSLLAIRIDYLVSNEPVKSVLLHGGIFDIDRTSELPWGKGGRSADVMVQHSELDGSQPLTFDVDAHAPAEWSEGDSRRSIISFWMENTGVESQAVFSMHGEP